MKNYKIVLESTGAVTQIPDSQKLFGALVTIFAEIKGENIATQMVKAILDKKIHLALSNLMPLNYLPMPQDYVVDKLAEKLTKDDNLKEQRAAVKTRNYVMAEDLKKIMQNPGNCDDIYPYIKQSHKQQFRASMDSVVYGLEGLETKLYTVPFLELQEVKKYNDLEEIMNSVSQFCFYLQGEESELLTDMLDLIEDLRYKKASLILGKRASQGLNKYQVMSIEPMKLNNAQKYLNLGMLLPNKINFDTSTLKLFTSERRPFAMPGGWNQNYGKYFISFIDIGSIITLRDGIEQAGKCVLSPYNKGRDIVFGNAFLYPVDL